MNRGPNPDPAMGASADHGAVHPRRAGRGLLASLRIGRRSSIGRFLADRRGSAVEFAMIGPVFLALLGAIIETALAFWANQVLENALSDASRQLYTGQFQTANKTTTDKTALLDKLRSEALCKVDGLTRTTIFTCADVKLDLRKVSQFSGSVPTSPVDKDTKDWANGFGTNYSSPAAGDIVVLQAAVKYPVFFTLLNPDQASFTDGSRVLQAAVVFRTEPY